MKWSHDSTAGNIDDIACCLATNIVRNIFMTKENKEKCMYNMKLKTQFKALGQNTKENVLSDNETWCIADKVRILSGHYQLRHSKHPLHKSCKKQNLKGGPLLLLLFTINIGSQERCKLNTYSSQQLFWTQICFHLNRLRSCSHANIFTAALSM